MEIFKDIEGFSGKYQVSNKGRIKSFHISDKGRIMKPEERNKKYLCIGLRLNMNKKNYVIHRLVANAFIDNPENKSQINHKDGNKLNNHTENLEWCTHSENMKHAFSTGLSIALKGEDTYNSTLNNKQARIIRSMKRMEIKQREVAKIFNTSTGVVGNIQRGKTYA